MSESKTLETMPLERLTVLLDAYGASPLRWPEDERRAAEALIAINPQAASLTAVARELDVTLDSAPMFAPSPALRTRVMTAFDDVMARPSVRRIINSIANIVWPGAPLWQPSAAFALSLLAGLVLGIASPLGSAQQAPNSDITVAFEVVPDSGF